MSSPATAGVVALTLEANPELTPADVRSILESTAREDEDTGILPDEGDHVWGHGKVTASQAVLAALTWDSTLGMADLSTDKPKVFPNPVRDQLWFSGLEIGASNWKVYDIHGKLCSSGNSVNLNSIDVSGLMDGFYLVQVRTESDLQEFKFMKRQ